MDEFIKRIEAYEEKMEQYLSDQKKQETRAKLFFLCIFLLFLGIILSIIYWPKIKLLIDMGKNLLDSGIDWILIHFFDYKIIVE